MNEQPRVVAIMLTANRTEMTRRAVRSFLSQTYQNKKLLIWDTGELEANFEDESGLIAHVAAEDNRKISIGALRNEANGFWTEYDIAVHWDSDDYSHPNRISEQVALLQASGKQCVGYRDMLFWRNHSAAVVSDAVAHAEELLDEYDLKSFERFAANSGEAWLYHNDDPRYCTGTSFAYYRSAWERRAFPAISRGEDKIWLREVDSIGVSSIVDDCPRMIAAIHSGNHVVYEPEKSINFKRAPEWDELCRKVMKL